MVKKNVCKQCKMFYDDDSCPGCKSGQKAHSWKGRINVIDAAKSEIAKKVFITVKGEYALKVR